MERLEKSIEVRCPVRSVYNQWTQFEELPRFMEDVVEVRQLDDTHLRWRARMNGKEKEWNAEITEQVPDERISWCSVDGAQNAGTVRFEPIDQERTRVRLAMAYEPEGIAENVGDALGVVSRHVEKSLNNFKEFIERRGVETGAWRGEVRDGDTVRGGREDSREAGTADTRRGRQGGERGGSGDERGGSRARGERGARRDYWPSRFSSLGGNDGPFSLMRRMMDDMDRVLSDFELPLIGRRRQGDEPTLWSPRIEVSQRGDQVVVTADLPGVKKEDVSVEIEDDRLVLQGERRSERESREGGMFRSECEYGSFYRVIPLPPGADASSAKASMDDGVLTVRLHAPQTHRGKRVPIETA